MDICIIEAFFMCDQIFYDNENTDAKNAVVCENNANNMRQGIDDADKRIKIYQPYIESYEYLDANLYIHFTEGQTDNIMDDKKEFGNKSKHDLFTSFFRWQWNIMQNEVKKYHS